MSKLTSQPSFNTMDQAFFLATGEHLPSRRGDACPHPLEWYILKAQQRQQRARAYTILLPRLDGTTSTVPVKPGSVNGVNYCFARLGAENEIYLFDGMNVDKPVLTLWPDGHEPEETTPACTPVRFTLKEVPRHARSRAVSPIPEHDTEDITGIVDAARVAASSSRLRKGFLQMLEKMSTESLRAELEGWQEEVERAKEHLDAVALALARR